MTTIEGPSSSREFALVMSWDQSILRVSPSGELDLGTGGRLVDAVESALAFRELSRHRVDVDLAELSFVDVCGFNSLLEVRRLAMDRGVSVGWQRPRVQLVRLLELIESTGRAIPIRLEG